MINQDKAQLQIHESSSCSSYICSYWDARVHTQHLSHTQHQVLEFLVILTAHDDAFDFAMLRLFRLIKIVKSMRMLLGL